MFGYVGNSQKDLEILYEALKNAANSDPTVPEEWKTDKDWKHSDGWGYVLFTGDSLVHYRTKTPIFDGAFKLPEIKGRVYAVFHARKASPHSPKGAAIFDHPFMAAAEKEIVFLARNGGVSYPHPKNTVDTEIELRKITKWGLEKSIPYFKMHTDGSLNLLALVIDRNDPCRAKLSYLNYWKDKRKTAYYRMFTKRMHGGNAVFSSTLNDDLHGKACRTGKLINL